MRANQFSYCGALTGRDHRSRRYTHARRPVWAKFRLKPPPARFISFWLRIRGTRDGLGSDSTAGTAHIIYFVAARVYYILVIPSTVPTRRGVRVTCARARVHTTDLSLLHLVPTTAKPPLPSLFPEWCSRCLYLMDGTFVYFEPFAARPG